MYDAMLDAESYAVAAERHSVPIQLNRVQLVQPSLLYFLEKIQFRTLQIRTCRRPDFRHFLVSYVWISSS